MAGKKRNRPAEQLPTEHLAPIVETPPGAEAIHSPAWRVVGAAVRGVSHARLDLPCQDAFAYRELPSGLLLVAVADGAGSASYSDQGAFVAASVVIDHLSGLLEESIPEDEHGWQSALRAGFSVARHAVLELADSAGESPRAFAATLTCAIAADNRLVVGQIGDGAVVAQEEDGALFTATRLQRGEYANETHFLIQEDALEQATISIFDRPVRALAVMSDGLIRLALKMPSQDPHVPFFQPLFGFTAKIENGAQADEQLAAFLDSERVNARTDDDKSLVLAVRVEPQPRVAEGAS